MYYIFLLEKGEPYISLYPKRLKKGESHKHLQGLLVLDSLPPLGLDPIQCILTNILQNIFE